MELLISILGAAGLGHMAADFFSRYEWMPDKPMKCNMCINLLVKLRYLLYYYMDGVVFYTLRWPLLLANYT